MIRTSPHQVTPQLRSLFDPGAPASLRCFAVLDGNAAGQIWADALSSPTWGIVREAAFGSLYFGGAPDAHTIGHVIADLAENGDVLIGLWRGDERWETLPPDPDYVGATLEFTGRPIGKGLLALLGPMPEGCQLRRIDRDMLQRFLRPDFYVSAFGSIEQALERGFGLCLMRGGEVLSEAFAGPSANGMIELGTGTREPHRGRGYATLTCAHLIRECEKRGFRTYWNCAKQNPASAAIARKLGYRTEKEYKLVAWLG
jgi:GNAT superfamily N-acetyltransferase